MFKDPALQDDFERNGFVIVDLLGGSQAAELLESLIRLEADAPAWTPEGGETLRQSFFHPDSAYRAAVDKAGRGLLEEALARFVSGYRLLAAGHFIKGPHTPAMNLHRDWTVVRDPQFPSLNVWCPLVPVDERNGTLAVLPGSQALPNVESAGVPRFYAAYGEVLKTLCVRPSLAPGQTLIFDNRVMHWSTPNATEAPRHVLRGICMPADERMVFYRLDVDAGGRRFEIVDVEDGGVLSGIPDDLEMGSSRKRSLGYIPNTNRPLSRSECVRILRRQETGPVWHRGPLRALARWGTRLSG